jgi:hypothetical protein
MRYMYCDTVRQEKPTDPIMRVEDYVRGAPPTIVDSEDYGIGPLNPRYVQLHALEAFRGNMTWW